MPSANRTSSYTQVSASSDHDRPKSSEKKELWSSMLDSVASGKRLPEKNILVLGGTPDSQREFLEALEVEDRRRPQDQSGSKQPPIANSYALGYTYHDALDADHDDILARLSLYLLSDPSPSFTPLLQPLLTPQSIPNTLIVVLLDWSQPWFWLRELRDWVRLLRTLLVSLDVDCKEKMEEVMISWRDRGRGGNSLDGGGPSISIEGDVSLPLGPGEWEEALGLPLCVVCQNSDRIEVLEKERGWKEEEFDFVLQTLRTVLLKHGASLIYTIPSVPSPLQSLIHASLSISSLLKRQPVKHNVIDRDKVVVSPNWDSWGKIRVLREGFDVEAVNNGWSTDIEESPPSAAFANGDPSNDENLPSSENYQETSSFVSPDAAKDGAIIVYESTIRDPRLDTLQASTNSTTNGLKLEVSTQDPQIFLGTQLEVLNKLKQEAGDEKVRGVDGSRLSRGVGGRQVSSEMGEGMRDGDEGRVNEHIGPVQFNMGGIQVDAEEMVQKLKDRRDYSTPEPTTPGATGPSNVGSPSTGPGGGKTQNEALASFFAGLMTRKGGAGSATGSPRPGA